MKLPENSFKRALLEGRSQIGLWVGLANAYASELLAGAGFDWLALDAEHSPNDPRTGVFAPLSRPERRRVF